MSDFPSWSESNTQTFLDFGRYFVPDREEQIEIICSLLPLKQASAQVVELCCGEGLLAATILERYPTSYVLGLDGSPAMLESACQNLSLYGERFRTALFDLKASDWRGSIKGVQAVVSSLAIHHLDGEGKCNLFRDVFGMLAEGGAFIVADLVQPSSQLGWELAADAYDEAVRQRALQLDGHTAMFEQFQKLGWNFFRYPEDELDHPSTLFEQLKWLEMAGFAAIEVHYLRAGHAIFSGLKV
jgi:tRNA (cmo5U34)-methyltransferase